MVWVSGELGWVFLGDGSFSSSTLIPWWQNSAISCEIPPVTFRATCPTDWRSDVVHSCSGSCGAATTVITPISSLKVIRGASSSWSCHIKCGRQCRCQYWGSCIHSTVDPSDWHDMSPSPQARPPKSAWYYDRSAISHGCVGWGGGIFLGQIPWRLCLWRALKWLSVVICEVSGFSWYILYVFLRSIVGEEKDIVTNVFRCHPKTIEVLTKKLGEWDPVENTCDK